MTKRVLGGLFFLLYFFNHCQELCILNMYTTRWEAALAEVPDDSDVN